MSQSSFIFDENLHQISKGVERMFHKSEKKFQQKEYGQSSTAFWNGVSTPVNERNFTYKQFYPENRKFTKQSHSRQVFDSFDQTYSQAVAQSTSYSPKQIPDDDYYFFEHHLLQQNISPIESNTNLNYFPPFYAPEISVPRTYPAYKSPNSYNYKKNYNPGKKYQRKTENYSQFKRNYKVQDEQISYDKNTVVSLDALKIGPKFSKKSFLEIIMKKFTQLYEYLTEVLEIRKRTESALFCNDFVPIRRYLPGPNVLFISEHYTYSLQCLNVEFDRLENVMKHLVKKLSSTAVVRGLVNEFSTDIQNLYDALEKYRALQNMEICSIQNTKRIDENDQQYKKFLDVLNDLIKNLREAGVQLMFLKHFVDECENKKLPIHAQNDKKIFLRKHGA